MSKARRFASFLRAHVAGFEASSVQAFARHLHARLGRRFLPEATQWALRQGIERGVETSLRTEIVNVSSASRSLAHELANHGAMQLLRHGGKGVTKVALRQLAGGIGRASAAGFVIDGALGAIDAYRGYRAGELSAADAWRHVGVEGVTGALACGGGVALAAGVVVVTGGLAPSSVFVLGAVGSSGIKYGLNRVARKHLGVGTEPESSPAS